MLTDIEMSIQEWFADADVNGKVEVAKLYTDIRIEIDKQLEIFLENEEKQNILILPARVGDSIVVKDGDSVETLRIDGFELKGDDLMIWGEGENELYVAFGPDEIIKYVPREAM